eukprot:g65520.t1
MFYMFDLVQTACVKFLDHGRYKQYSNDDMDKTIMTHRLHSSLPHSFTYHAFMHGCGGNCTLFTIDTVTACDVSKITFYSNEKESLLAPGTQLKVKSSKRNGKISEIRLEEVGRCLS